MIVEQEDSDSDVEEIPAKHLDHKPKALDPPDLTEPEPNT
jgi:hypothetical protein